jgi:hypothetical protein
MVPIVAAIPALAILWFTLAEWRDLAVGAPFVEVRGQVIERDCHNHGRYTVRFPVGDASRVSASQYHDSCSAV